MTDAKIIAAQITSITLAMSFEMRNIAPLIKRYIPTRITNSFGRKLNIPHNQTIIADNISIVPRIFGIIMFYKRDRLLNCFCLLFIVFLFKMRVSALASGSSGNCFYVESHDKAVLVDAGISAKQIIERLKVVGGDPSKVKGVFITHEHSDHIRGVDVFARAYEVPIFVTKDTARSGFLCSNEDLINVIKNDETVKIGKMEVNAFSKSHKCVDPVSYSIFNDITFSITFLHAYPTSVIIDNFLSLNILY